MKNKKILIVDDILDNTILLDLEVRKLGYSTYIARDGITAINIAKEHSDLVGILLDVHMPEMDGYEVCRRLKADSMTKDIPIIFITAKYKDENDLIRGLELGAIDYITKPFVKSELKARISNIAKIKEYLDELKELNRIKNEFLGLVAHDLRNPVGAIAMLAYSLSVSNVITDDLKNNQFFKNTVTHIMDTSDHCLNIVNQLLDIVKMNSVKMELELDRINPLLIIQQVVDRFEIFAKKKNIHIKNNIPSDLKVTTNIDRNKFMEIIENLISNAIKYSYHDSVVEINVTQSNREITFEIKDNGQGLYPEEIDKVFTPFEKISSTPTDGENSTGLGLSIVKKLIEAHNGRISVVSSGPDKGTSFFTTLSVA